MIWHILKKDLRLMWGLVACVVLVALFGTGLRAAVGTAPISSTTSILLNLLPLGLDIAIAFITVTVVQQDNLLGDRQDWLLRPIPNGNVMLAKWLFVLAAVHGPLLLIDMLEVKLTGISLARSLVPALSHQCVLFCCYTAPALMVGAMTRTIVGALSFVVALLIGFAAVMLFEAIGGVPRVFVTATGYSWVVVGTTLLIYVALIAALVRFQFRERREVAARVLFVITTATAIALLYNFPLGAALKVQQRIDVALVGSNKIALAFTAAPLDSPNAGGAIAGVRRVVGASAGVAPPLVRGDLPSPLSDRVTGVHIVTLPIQVSGLAADELLVTDWADIRIAALDGKLIFESDGPVCARKVHGSYCFPADFTARQKKLDGGVVGADLRLPIPIDLYAQIKDQPVMATIDFTLTWLRQAALQSMRAVNDNKLVEGVGRCTSGIDLDGDEIEMRCLSAVRRAACVSLALENSRTGARNPPAFECLRDYAPFPFHVRNAAVVQLNSAELSFLDPNGLAHYPVDATQIGDGQIVIRTYTPQAHFKRQLAIPKIRLLDWDDQQSKPVAP